jgi:hypothetical protein
LCSAPVRATGFPRSWIDTRNFFTYWDKELEPKVVTAQALYEANVPLRVLLRVVYLHFAGVDPQVLEKALLGTNPLAQHLIQLNFPDTPMMEIRLPDPQPASDALLVAGQGQPELQKTSSPVAQALETPSTKVDPQNDAVSSPAP